MHNHSFKFNTKPRIQAPDTNQNSKLSGNSLNLLHILLHPNTYPNKPPRPVYPTRPLIHPLSLKPNTVARVSPTMVSFSSLPLWLWYANPPYPRIAPSRLRALRELENYDGQQYLDILEALQHRLARADINFYILRCLQFSTTTILLCLDYLTLDENGGVRVQWPMISVVRNP